MAAKRRLMIWRCGRAAVLPSMAFVLASCAAQASPDPTAGVRAGQLRIEQGGVAKAVPSEGAFSFIRIESATGTKVTERRLPGSGRLTVSVPPGTYRLVSWQRFCDGNCGHLDRPSGQCARPFTLRPGEHLQAVIRVNYVSRCVIELRR
jgi:hypothetical protein